MQNYVAGWLKKIIDESGAWIFVIVCSDLFNPLFGDRFFFKFVTFETIFSEAMSTMTV